MKLVNNGVFYTLDLDVAEYKKLNEGRVAPFKPDLLKKNYVFSRGLLIPKAFVEAPTYFLKGQTYKNLPIKVTAEGLDAFYKNDIVFNLLGLPVEKRAKKRFVFTETQGRNRAFLSASSPLPDLIEGDTIAVNGLNFNVTKEFEARASLDIMEFAIW